MTPILDSGSIALVIALSTLAFTVIGLRQTTSRDDRQIDIERVRDLERRMEECEMARVELAKENLTLMRQVLGLPQVRS